MLRAPALVVTAALAIACAPTEKATATPQPPVPDLQARFEHGLVQAIRIRGEETPTKLAERMKALHIPAVSIAVFDDYRIVWAEAYGIADTSTQQPLSERTLFQAGSISKSVNALAVLRAVADGKLDLDAPVNQQLRSWKLPDNELTRDSPVTLRRLLSHTAGTTVHGFPGYAVGTPVPTLVEVLDGKPPANTPAVRVDLRPGSQFRYSGGGTSITQLVLVDTLGAPYPEILRDRVLDPIGMVDSTFAQPLPPGRLAQAAAGHRSDGTVVPGKRHTYPEMAAAGLWTTPTDLCRFFLELTLALAGRSNVIPRELALQMTTEVDAKEHVGLGVFLDVEDGAPVRFGHGGADEGFQAHAKASLAGGYGLVVMTNSDNGGQLFAEIERTVAAAMGWPGGGEIYDRIALTAVQREHMVGRFLDGQGVPWDIAVAGDALMVALPFGKQTELVPIAATSVASPHHGLVFAFAADGKTMTLTDDSPIDATRIDTSTRLPLLELAAGRVDDAIAVWRTGLAATPDAPAFSEDLHIGFANHLLHGGDVDGALVILRALVVVFPASAQAYATLAEAETKAGHTEAAIDAYEAVLAKLEADPRVPEDVKAGARQQIEGELERLRTK